VISAASREHDVTVIFHGQLPAIQLQILPGRSLQMLMLILILHEVSIARVSLPNPPVLVFTDKEQKTMDSRAAMIENRDHGEGPPTNE
jgi:hypothetical protein